MFDNVYVGPDIVANVIYLDFIKPYRWHNEYCLIYYKAVLDDIKISESEKSRMFQAMAAIIAFFWFSLAVN
jgi:hypothetical protein